ncbi:MAG: GtrA family protein [Clostridia bacterium]|jgi:putative flippase GtrA|nr:GtrA family protein [Clostridia bacterium]
MKHKEVINYLIFGFLSFVVSMATYYLARICFDYVISNIISWIIAVIFSYVTNKLFVFESKIEGKRKLVKEFVTFILSRIFTLVLETLILYMMVDLMNMNDRMVKVIAQIIVILMNYILSKLIIFKKKKTEEIA